ncbi:MAG: hypothetical protein WCZ66_07080 [Sphingomonadaceae bacterium]
MADEVREMRAPRILATIATLAWIAFVAGLFLLQPISLLDNPANLLLWVAGALAPPAAFFALAESLRGRRSQTSSVIASSEDLELAESRMAGIATRIDALRTHLAGDIDALASAATQVQERGDTARKMLADLVASSEAANAAGNRLASLIPTATDASARLPKTLEEIGEAVDSHLARLEESRNSLEHGAESLGATGASITHQLTESLNALDARAAQTRAASETAMRTLRSEADSLFEINENAATSIRQLVQGQAESLSTTIAEARSRLDRLGGDTAREISQRLDAMLAAADGFEQKLANHGQQTEHLAATAERSFHLIDARIRHSETTSMAALERLSTRIAEVNGGIDGLSVPLKAAKMQLEEMATSTHLLQDSAAEAVMALGELLPERSIAAASAAGKITGEISRLIDAVDQAHARAEGLLTPIAEGRAALDTAVAVFAQQRDNIAAAGQMLVVELNHARELIAEVEQQTDSTSLAAATRLVDAMSRVRDVASQTATTVRTTLDGVIDAARDSLSETATAAMKQSFAEPIAQQAREAAAAAESASDAARHAAERTAASMSALASTLKLLDARTMERIAEVETSARQEILSAAQLLADRLSSDAIAISTALDKPMSDADWHAWRKGERGMFNRRAVALLERRERRELQQLLGNDSSFADAARRYTVGFDALLRRIDPAGDSPLTPALLSSEQGRLAAILSEALEG